MLLSIVQGVARPPSLADALDNLPEAARSDARRSRGAGLRRRSLQRQREFYSVARSGTCPQRNTCGSGTGDLATEDGPQIEVAI